VSKEQKSLSNDKTRDSMLNDFIRGLCDYFNPLIQVIEELQRDSKKHRKK